MNKNITKTLQLTSNCTLSRKRKNWKVPCCLRYK